MMTLWKNVVLALIAFASVVSLKAQSAPQLVAPADGGIVFAVPALQWQPTTTAQVSYDVELSLSATFANIAVSQTVTTTTYQIGGSPLVNTVWYWRVRQSGSTTAAWSAVRSFRISRPTSLVLVQQSTNAIASNSPLTLQYETRDPFGLRSPVTQQRIIVHQILASGIVVPAGTNTSVAIPVGSSTAQITLTLINDTPTTVATQINATPDSELFATSVTVTVQPPVLLRPVHVAPANQAINVASPTLLSWLSVVNATGYEYQVSRSNNFTQPVSTGVVTVTSATVPTTVGAQHYWRVRAITSGNASAWTDPTDFTTQSPALAGPVLLTPSDNATSVALSPSISWNAVQFALRYSYEVSASSTFATTIASGTTTATTVQLSALAPLTTYYWRVRPENDAVSGPQSQFSFTTGFSPVQLLSPTNGTVNAPLNISFIWSTQANAAAYLVQISSENTFTSTTAIVFNSNVTTPPVGLNAGLLQNNVQYYWRVRAVNVTGQFGEWSPVWSVRTIPTLLTPPTLIAPANQATNISTTNATLNWSRVNGAVDYVVELSESMNFTTQFSTQFVNGTTLTVSGLSFGRVYYWRARSRDNNGASEWSAPFSFTTTSPTLVAPVQLLPIAGSTTVQLPVALSWTSVTNATSYAVEVGLYPNITTLVVSNVTSATAITVQGLAPRTQYIWRVRSLNAATQSEWSSTRAFTTILPAPTLTIPAAGATSQSITGLTFGWNAVAPGAQYEIQVSRGAAFTSASLLVNATVASTTYASPTLLYGETYYWRVRAVDAIGNSEWSEVRLFSTVPAPFGAPILRTPVNNATSANIVSVFTWSDLPLVTGYQLQVSFDAGFTSTVYNAQQLATTASFTLPEYSRTYYWRVRGVDNSGFGPWSSVFSFRSQAAPFGRPNLLFPANRSVAVELFPSLVWRAGTGVLDFQVQLAAENYTGTNPDFSNPVVDRTVATDTIFTPELLRGTKYSWRVRGRDGFAFGEWSTVATFTTIEQNLAAPALLAPANGSVGVGRNVTLEWQSVSSATRYIVELSENEEFTTLFARYVSDDTTEAAFVDLDKTYFWRVRAANALGNGPWSVARRFSTRLFPLETPVLTVPADNATEISLDPTLRWLGVRNATSYRVQVSLTSDFTALVLNTTTDFNFFNVVRLERDSRYFWRVRAISNGQLSDWSEVRDFRTIPFTLGVPPMIAPAAGAENLPITVRFDWGFVPNAQFYHLQVVDDKNSIVFEDSLLTSLNISVQDLEYNTDYRWRVRARRLSSASNWSVYRNFRTISDVLPAPVLVSPANNATAQPLEPVLRWNSVNGATSYAVEVFNPDGSLVFARNNITSVEIRVNGLRSNTRYTWRARAVNAIAQGEWSAPWAFTTQELTLQAPTLFSPFNNSVEQPRTLDLRWVAVFEAERYEVELYDANDQIVLRDANVQQVTFRLENLPGNTLYRWRVRAFSGTRTSAWSETWNFRTSTAVSVDEDNNVAGLALKAFPNPFVSEVTLLATVAQPGIAYITLTNSVGEVVHSMTTPIQTAGQTRITFAPATMLANGMYFCRLTINGQTISLPLMVKR